jgi:hypothetical protein
MSIQNQTIKCDNCNRCDFKSKGGLTLHKKKCQPKNAIEILDEKAKDFIQSSPPLQTEQDKKIDAYFVPNIKKEKDNTLYNNIFKFYEYKPIIEKLVDNVERLTFEYEHKKNKIINAIVIPEAEQLIKDEWKSNVEKGKAPPKKQRQTTIFENTKTKYKSSFDELRKSIGLTLAELELNDYEKLKNDLDIEYKTRCLLNDMKLEDIPTDNTQEFINIKLEEQKEKKYIDDLKFANNFLDNLLKDYDGRGMTLEQLAKEGRIGMMSGLECNGIDIRELARQRLKSQSL